MVAGFATLSSSHQIPVVGLGTWKSPVGQVQTAVEFAIKNGYRHIDCAAAYENEKEVGAAFASVFAEGVVAREDLFVTSKLPNWEKGDVLAQCKRTLADLGLAYLDLYLIHWPVVRGCKGDVLTPSIKSTWTDMEALVDAGLVRSIGVSNFSTTKLTDMLSYCRIPPAVVQVELHPYWQWNKLLTFAAEHNIHVTAYSPLGSPDSAFGKEAPQLLKEPVITAAAAAVGRSPGQVLLRWGLQRGYSVIPKSVTPERILQNLDILSWELPADVVEKINSIGPQRRFIMGSHHVDPEGPFKTVEQLWDGEL